MARSLRDILAEFVGKPPGTIGVAVIHMPAAAEREPLIRALETACGCSVEIFLAVNGAERIAAGHPTRCATEPAKIRTAGEIGCLLSHVELARRALAEGKSHMMVFEDDCVTAPKFSLAAVEEYLRSVKRLTDTFSIEDADDFLLFGTCGCYAWKHLTQRIKATNKFNGSHCYLIGRSAMEKLVGSYEYLLKKDVIVPVDGLISLLLKAQNRWALCPDDDRALFVQNRDIPSYILGDGKTLREE
jgi:GR25 family glycosyltransferase involved in LPS biosynthesis